ncbi:protein phosphatase 2C domain-containing protein [Streptomyces sp. NBC_00885]|uniref:protein phosphatase 2C domain-containing protein n=1 Tax=Streptomyces sp. NBC_00885 TaxID=2975857 RepID=UPI00386AA37C|nr:protein phosphatase 2C domain-containing protein [Streptomyces sp. NBC_00885]
MRVSFATSPRPGHENEDFVIASPDVAVVLDGAGIPDGLSTGCVHGVPWFVRQLGTDLHRRATEQRTSLTECLADSIHHVSQLHASTCDLNDPMTPTATVAMARIRSESLEWLALSDSTIVISAWHGLQTVADHRVSDVTARQRLNMAASLEGLTATDRRRKLVYAQRDVMNQADGYWVAAHDPKAAEEALTGSAPLSDIKTVALLTDGAARPVDDFHEMTWPEAIQHLEAAGPQGLIDRARAMENADPDAQRWPRGKRHDDATAVLLRF